MATRYRRAGCQQEHFSPINHDKSDYQVRDTFSNIGMPRGNDMSAGTVTTGPSSPDPRGSCASRNRRPSKPHDIAGEDADGAAFNSPALFVDAPLRR